MEHSSQGAVDVLSLQDWLTFLRHCDRGTAVPLIVVGAALMLFGWRMWKLCVVASFALVGAAIGWKFAPAPENQWMFALGGGVVLGLASYWPVNLAVALLGGLIGGAVVAHSFEGMGLRGPTLWCIGGAAFLACTAMAYLNRQRVVIVVTAFLGAALLMSGLITLSMASPTLFGALRSVGSAYAIVVPFLLLVPTVMSSFYQMSEIRRLGAEP